MESAYIGIGSNIGNKIHNCRKAISLMEGLEGCSIRARSPFYRTEPVGVEGQDFYVNGVICMDTDLSAGSLLKRLLKIEKDMGRVRRKKWDARVIDLDILLFGTLVIEEPDLTVPHPLMHLRLFALMPLLQIAPGLIHPVLGEPVSELAGKLAGNDQAVEPYEAS
jgi:2-amino-4-hydroxy-6-hydroxymethyldihydropteridine diphosphokinase